jgi:biotin carboxyl carrier protein
MNSARLFILAAVIIASSVAGHRAFAEEVVTMPAVQKRVVTMLSAPAHVQAASNTVLSAPTAGIVSGLRVLPGETVRSGQTIAHLTGPTVSADGTRLAADLKSAQIRVSAATQAAAIEQQKLDEQLSTRDAVVRVRAELDTARQQLVAAQSAVRSYTSFIAIGVPEPGVVTAVNAGDGQYVSAGQTLITVAPSRGLHVVANLYGNDASLVTNGMKGGFLAEGTNAPIDVVVQRVVERYRARTTGSLAQCRTRARSGDGNGRPRFFNRIRRQTAGHSVHSARARWRPVVGTGAQQEREPPATCRSRTIRRRLDVNRAGALAG